MPELSDDKPVVSGIERLLTRAVSFIRVGDLDSADILLDQLLSRQPAHPDGLNLKGVIALRRGAADLAIGFLKQATDADPSFPAYWLHLGDAEQMAGRIDRALEAYAQADSLEGGRGEAGPRLRGLWRATGQAARADAHLGALFEKGDAPPAAHAERVGQLAAQGCSDQHLSDAVSALRDSHPKPDDLCVAARSLYGARMFSVAEGLWRDALGMVDADPALRADIQHDLALCLKQAGNLEAARPLLEDAVALAPDDPVRLGNLANLLADLGEHEPAEAAYLKALALRPDHLETLNNYGLLKVKVGDPDTAIVLYEQALARDRRHVAVLNNYGNVLLRCARFDDAEAAFSAAAEIRPEDGTTWNNIGLLHYRRCNFVSADKAFRKALKLAPGSYEIHNNFGLFRLSMEDFETAEQHMLEAIRLNENYLTAWLNLATLRALQTNWYGSREMLEWIVEKDPENALALGNLGAAYVHLRQYDLAIEYLERALEIEPDAFNAVNSMGMALVEMGRPLSGLEYLERSSDLSRGGDGIFASNAMFSAHYNPDLGPAELFERHKRWHTYVHDLEDDRPLEVDRDPDRQLRIGYFSPDFRKHAVSLFAEPAFLYHDRAAFRIFAYKTGPESDERTVRFKRLSDEWRDFQRVSPDNMLKRILDDRIDILIDLSGHTAHNCMALLARKPAPLIVSHIGYPNTTGVDAIDYRIVDAVTDPPGAEAYATETLIRLPDVFLCFRPHADAPAIAEPPHLSAGYVTFGTFNTPPKINDRVIAVWAQILERVPDSRLLLKGKSLKNKSVRADFRSRFEACGIDPDRVQTAGLTMDIADHLRVYGSVDIALDTFPYNGTTTTCEALWQGVPVISILGQSHHARVTGSLLTCIGAAEHLLADGPEDYIERAVALAGDSARQRELRFGLRRAMSESPLCDARGYVAKLETVYRQIWREFCASGATPWLKRVARRERADLQDLQRLSATG